MTRYEQGFMSKCAEYGIDAGTAMGLMKIAVSGVVSGPLGGAGQMAGGVLANAKPVSGPLGGAGQSGVMDTVRSGLRAAGNVMKSPWASPVGLAGRALSRLSANGSARNFLARTPGIRSGLAGRIARLPYGRYAPTQPTSVVYGH